MIWFIDTENPIAVESYDHIEPKWSTIDTSYNLAFNDKLYQIYQRLITVLDIGCGGGAFVKSLIDNGHDSVGLDGTDTGLVNKLMMWPVMPDNLFTCDCTKPFIVHRGDHIAHKFDVVTAWEFLEHIEEKDLPQTLANICKHINGLFILSVPGNVYHVPNYKLDHHRTRISERWWQGLIEANGFIRQQDIEEYFGEDWVRFHKRGVRHVYRNKEGVIL